MVGSGNTKPAVYGKGQGQGEGTGSPSLPPQTEWNIKRRIHRGDKNPVPTI